MRLAFDSGRAGMTAASNQMDSAAVRIARDTLPVSAPAAAPSPSGLPSSSPGSTGYLTDDLVGAVPDMLVARESFAVNAATARYADDAYRSALSLLDHR